MAEKTPKISKRRETKETKKVYKHGKIIQK